MLCLGCLEGRKGSLWTDRALELNFSAWIPRSELKYQLRDPSVTISPHPSLLTRALHVGSPLVSIHCRVTVPEGRASLLYRRKSLKFGPIWTWNTWGVIMVSTNCTPPPCSDLAKKKIIIRYIHIHTKRTKTTAPRIPAWSPTVVLTRRHSG